MEYLKTERQTLQEARQLCTQIIYCNRMQKALQERKQRAQMVFDYTNRMQQSGEVSLMESNSAKLFLVQITHAIQNNDFEIKSLLRQLQSLNGGKAIVLADTIYPNSLANKDMMSNNYIDSLISSCIANNPELQSLNIDKEIAEKEVRLAKSQYLPSSLGIQRRVITGRLSTRHRSRRKSASFLQQQESTGCQSQDKHLFSFE